MYIMNTMYRNRNLLVVLLLTISRLCGGIHVHIPSWRILQSRAHQKIDTTLTVEHLQPYLRSQRAEDLTLYSKYFCQLTNGTYLELGALDGVKGSNSYLFEMFLGWRGVLIEASPKSYASLVANRPNSIAMNAAVCESYEQVHYAMGGQHPAVHGILEFMSDKFKQAFHPQWREYNETDAPAVPCYPLESLLKLSGLMHFQFFSLDVEGAELQVLQSINFRSVTFDVILVEADGTNQRKDLAVRRFLQHHGYKFIEHVTHNDWFVRNDWTPLPC